MGKVSAVRRIQFCSGHRVHQHESKCANLHGHNYVAFFHAEAPDLDSVGRVIDFSVLKERIGTWIDEHWDHTTILFQDDIETITHVNACPRNKSIFTMPTNPTAENMASFLLREICPMLFSDTPIVITKIVLFETENCSVEVSL